MSAQVTQPIAVNVSTEASNAAVAQEARTLVVSVSVPMPASPLQRFLNGDVRVHFELPPARENGQNDDTFSTVTDPEMRSSRTSTALDRMSDRSSWCRSTRSVLTTNSERATESSGRHPFRVHMSKSPGLLDVFRSQHKQWLTRLKAIEKVNGSPKEKVDTFNDEEQWLTLFEEATTLYHASSRIELKGGGEQKEYLDAIAKAVDSFQELVNIYGSNRHHKHLPGFAEPLARNSLAECILRRNYVLCYKTDFVKILPVTFEIKCCNQILDNFLQTASNYADYLLITDPQDDEFLDSYERAVTIWSNAFAVFLKYNPSDENTVFYSGKLRRILSTSVQTLGAEGGRDLISFLEDLLGCLTLQHHAIFKYCPTSDTVPKKEDVPIGVIQEDGEARPLLPKVPPAPEFIEDLKNRGMFDLAKKRIDEVCLLKKWPIDKVLEWSEAVSKDIDVYHHMLFDAIFNYSKSSSDWDAQFSRDLLDQSKRSINLLMELFNSISEIDEETLKDSPDVLLRILTTAKRVKTFVDEHIPEILIGLGLGLNREHHSAFKVLKDELKVVSDKLKGFVPRDRAVSDVSTVSVNSSLLEANRHSNPIDIPTQGGEEAVPPDSFKPNGRLSGVSNEKSVSGDGVAPAMAPPQQQDTENPFIARANGVFQRVADLCEQIKEQLDDEVLQQIDLIEQTLSEIDPIFDHALRIEKGKENPQFDEFIAQWKNLVRHFGGIVGRQASNNCSNNLIMGKIGSLQSKIAKVKKVVV